MIAVFLDLDGTLVDSKPGIIASLKAAFTDIGRPDLSEGDLSHMIGPPFVDTFKTLGLDDPHAAIEAYRRHYAAGAMFDAKVYDGIQEMIGVLRDAEFRLYLATAKPHVAAKQITRHFGLSDHMEAEFGPELDGTRNWKGDLLAYALEQTSERADAAVMVGDRHHDFAAAAAVGMPSVAVKWGYGRSEEWDIATHQIDRPSVLLPTIQRLKS